MKRKLYSNVHAPDVLGRLDLASRFTAEERALVTELEQPDEPDSRETLVRAYLSQNGNKLAAVGVLIDRLYAGSFTSVVSLGAGPCVLEHLVAAALPPEASVAATDFDTVSLERARRAFPELTIARFDFCREDSATLPERLGGPIDSAVFFGSAYVMTDAEFSTCLRGLWSAGVRRVFDFHAGFLENVPLLHLRDLRATIAPRSRVRAALGRETRTPTHGKFHGYGRSRRELHRVYRAGRGRVVEELRGVGAYPYVGVIDPA